ncbi:MAG: aminoglycoside phosphotransferase family protein [Gammaproteobacteria bacterium]|nr:aminoglycoside phosphotransferase family protein [Gammaproteobacteria bacterium]
MSSREFQVPEPVRLRAESLGTQGAKWVAGLGASVDYLERRWSIRVGSVLAGGSESLVVEAEFENGTSAILKVGLPGSADLGMEARVYGLAAGRGYANLFEHDSSHNALLMERLGKPLASARLPVAQQIARLCETLSDAWIPLDSPSGLMTGAEKARWLAEFIIEKWQFLDQPCDRSTIDRALLFAEEREDAFAPESSVLIHGDAHAFNTLLVPGQLSHESRHKFVDPDGLFAERACDLAVPMRDWSAQLLAGDTMRLARERCQLLAELTGVAERAIWQWGYVERISTSMVLLEIGMTDEGFESLGVAERLCDA